MNKFEYVTPTPTERIANYLFLQAMASEAPSYDLQNYTDALDLVERIIDSEGEKAAIVEIEDHYRNAELQSMRERIAEQEHAPYFQKSLVAERKVETVGRCRI